MNFSIQTLWADANNAFRNKDFERAIALYEQALNAADGRLKARIRFNLNIARRRLGIDVIEEANEILPLSTPCSATIGDSLTSKMSWKQVAEEIKPFFDDDFYRVNYVDIDLTDIEPVEHYSSTGWREGLNPNSEFSTAYYLDVNPDVASTGINPFWHYLTAGRAEKRESRHPGGYKAEILKTLPSLEQIVRQWKKAFQQPEPLMVVQVIQLITDNILAETNSLAISIGHDHYKKISGGIQLCIQMEEQLARERGILYLNVHPWQPLPRLAAETEESDPLVCLVLQGQDIGVCRSSSLTQAIKQIAVQELHVSIHVIVHSLLGHAIEHVKNLAKLREDRRCWFWLHDFFTLCPSYALQRNNISFCGAPTIDSNACSICIYGDERRSHMQRMNDFFQHTAATLISPSEVTKQFWLSKTNLPATRVEVIPHMEMSWIRHKKPVVKKTPQNISVGFLGGAVYHKGWHVFESLVKIFVNNPSFRFVHFGNSSPPLSGIEHVNVHVTADDCFAMSRAVFETEIDFVLHWATWPETFSFTTHEAIAGGAYVLTNSISGNVAAVVQKCGMGAVFRDEQSLISFFKEGTVEQMANTRRANSAARTCQPSFSEMSIPFLLKKGLG